MIDLSYTTGPRVSICKTARWASAKVASYHLRQMMPPEGDFARGTNSGQKYFFTKLWLEISYLAPKWSYEPIKQAFPPVPDISSAFEKSVQKLKKLQNDKFGYFMVLDQA